MKNLPEEFPLISVIITSYNYANYIARAIKSVQVQSYPNIEILVIDDGSTDNTRKIVENFKTVSYKYQQNKGLSAARNKGIKESDGQYLVFLDADDWLESDGIFSNFKAINNQPEAALIYGNYFLHRVEENKTEQFITPAYTEAYRGFLRSNYIGMHATVMFNRWIFNEFSYDENLISCEDYDLYLKITRKHPILKNDDFIATYYFHPKGLSHNYAEMIFSIRRVMENQKAFLKDPREYLAWRQGKNQWKEYYCLELYKKLNTGNFFTQPPKIKQLLILFIYNRELFSALFRKNILFVKNFINKKKIFKNRTLSKN